MKSVAFSVFLFVASLGMAFGQDDSGINLNVGGGISLLGNWIDQQWTNQGYSWQAKYSTSSFGFNGFVDITKYFTVKLGYRMAIGQYNEDITANSYHLTGEPYTASNNISQFEIGGEFKYPIEVNEGFSWAPKIGLDYVGYLGGGIGGTDLSNVKASSDWKQLYSPIYITLGADLDFPLVDRWFVRVPLDLGFALNAKMSGAFYGSTATYTSSSSVAARAGLEFGYSL